MSGEPDAGHRPRPTLQARRAAATRQDILAEARRVLGVQGIEATTMGQIAEAAGITRATLYNYFPGKDELVRAAIAEIVDNFRWMSTAGQGEPDLHAALLTFVERRTEQIVANPADFRFLHRTFGAAVGSDIHDLVDSLLVTFQKSIGDLLAEAAGRGEIRGEVAVDLTDVAVDFLGAMLGIDRLYLHDPVTYPYGPAARQLVDRMVDYLTRAR